MQEVGESVDRWLESTNGHLSPSFLGHQGPLNSPKEGRLGDGGEKWQAMSPLYQTHRVKV